MSEPTQALDWRAMFPEAAAEITPVLEPLILLRKDALGEYWESSQYSVYRRVYADDPVFGSRGGMIYLGISNADNTARRDFRHFQAIKNQLAGPEWEAIEIYPAESRLVDPSNCFLLWCFKVAIKVGPKHAITVPARHADAPQRRLPDEEL